MAAAPEMHASETTITGLGLRKYAPSLAAEADGRVSSSGTVPSSSMSPLIVESRKAVLSDAGSTPLPSSAITAESRATVSKKQRFPGRPRREASALSSSLSIREAAKGWGTPKLPSCLRTPLQPASTAS